MKKRRPSIAARKLYATVREASAAIILLERQLYDVGLIKTAHALNRVTRELGWEASEKFGGGAAKVVDPQGPTSL